MRRIEYDGELSFLMGANRFPGGLKPLKSATSWDICSPIGTAEKKLATVLEPAEKACFVNSCSCMSWQSSSSLLWLGVSDAANAASKVGAANRGKCLESA